MSEIVTTVRAPQPGAECLAEPLRSRWSPSVFDAHFELSDVQVGELLSAGRWAPSAGNTQPWHWMVAQRGSVTHEHLVATLSRGNSGWVPRASVVLVGVVQSEEVDGEPPLPWALYDAGQAAAHITLQARAMGLHAHQFAGFDHEEFGRRVGIPATHHVLPAIAVGQVGDPDDVDERTAERDTRPRERRPLAQTAFEGTWGQPWSGLTHLLR